MLLRKWKKSVVTSDVAVEAVLKHPSIEVGHMGLDRAFFRLEVLQCLGFLVRQRVEQVLRPLREVRPKWTVRQHIPSLQIRT